MDVIPSRKIRGELGTFMGCRIWETTESKYPQCNSHQHYDSWFQMWGKASLKLRGKGNNHYYRPKETGVFHESHSLTAETPGTRDSNYLWTWPFCSWLRISLSWRWLTFSIWRKTWQPANAAFYILQFQPAENDWFRSKNPKEGTRGPWLEPTTMPGPILMTTEIGFLESGPILTQSTSSKIWAHISLATPRRRIRLNF